VAGKLQKPFFGIPVGTPVGVALGDFQCSALSSTSQPSDAGDMDKLNDLITLQCLTTDPGVVPTSINFLDMCHCEVKVINGFRVVTLG